MELTGKLKDEALIAAAGFGDGARKAKAYLESIATTAIEAGYSENHAVADLRKAARIAGMYNGQGVQALRTIDEKYFEAANDRGSRQRRFKDMDPIESNQPLDNVSRGIYGHTKEFDRPPQLRALELSLDTNLVSGARRYHLDQAPSVRKNRHQRVAVL